MKAQVESISPVKTRLSIEVPAEEIAREEDAAYRDLRRTATIAGFRKGKAPLSMVKKLYGDRVRSDVWSRVIQKTYQQALRDEDIVPVADAEIQLQSASEDDGLSYTAVVEVRPTVEPRGYEGLALQKERAEVLDEEVEQHLERLRGEHATFEPAPDDHEVASGDMVVVDYEGSIDGEPFDGGSGQDRPIMIGAGMFVPGFEEGLLGARVGEERTVEVTFPDEYRSEELAGKAAKFAVTVKEVKLRKLPDLDDEFAKEVAEAEGVEELRQRTREALLAEKQRRADSAFRERVIDALLDANPFEVPPSLVQRQQAHSLERIRQDLARRGMDLEDIGLDPNAFMERQAAAAERAVRWAFLVQALAETLDVEIADADVDERIREIASADGRPESLVRAFFEQNDQLDRLRDSLLERRVIDRVVEAATVEEVAPGGLDDQEGEG